MIVLSETYLVSVSSFQTFNSPSAEFQFLFLPTRTSFISSFSILSPTLHPYKFSNIPSIFLLTCLFQTIMFPGSPYQIHIFKSPMYSQGVTHILFYFQIVMNFLVPIIPEQMASLQGFFFLRKCITLFQNDFCCCSIICQ